jgi:branched-chain amino acid transport system permease protein
VEKIFAFLKSKWWLPLVLAISIVGPLGLGTFWVHIATEMLIMAVFAMSFSLLYGHTGLLSFGQAAFFGLGAYGAALMMTKTAAPFLVCLLVGALAGSLWSFVTAYLCVRFVGMYFGVMTTVVCQSTFYVIFNWYGFTGGDNGIQGLLPPPILQGPLAYYYFSLLIVIAAVIMYCVILNSPFGLSLRCIRDNTERSIFVGINVRRQIHVAFFVAGIYASTAGVLLAPFKRSVVPHMCDWVTSGNAVFMGILGGVFSLGGPIVGAVVWTFLDAFVTGFTEYWAIIIGCIILLVILYMPGGILGQLEQKFMELKHSRKSHGVKGIEIKR